jgi:hypothetical protein
MPRGAHPQIAPDGGTVVALGAGATVLTVQPAHATACTSPVADRHHHAVPEGLGVDGAWIMHAGRVRTLSELDDTGGLQGDRQSQHRPSRSETGAIPSVRHEDGGR